MSFAQQLIAASTAPPHRTLVRILRAVQLKMNNILSLSVMQKSQQP
jgi:hypothetical protein